MNLGIVAPIPGDGTSLYRAWGPLSYLAREVGPSLRLICHDEWGWPELMELDAMFLQRPYLDAHGMIAKFCSHLNIPLWVDYDDDYSCFPDWCPSQQAEYGSPRALEVMGYCLNEAKAVTVSTEALTRLSPAKAVVIPNALNTYIWPMSELPRSNVISWRGSGGHDGDLDSILSDLRVLFSNERRWSMHFFGRPDWRCAKLGEVHPYRDVFSYMEQLHLLAPAIHVVPLCDIPFNRAKSNNAWLEATSTGAIVVAPDLPEWRRPGVLTYKPREFYGAARAAMIMSEKQRLSEVAKSRKYILDNLTLPIVNKMRLEVLKRL